MEAKTFKKMTRHSLAGCDTAGGAGAQVPITRITNAGLPNQRPNLRPTTDCKDDDSGASVKDNMFQVLAADTTAAPVAEKGVSICVPWAWPLLFSGFMLMEVTPHTVDVKA